MKWIESGICFKNSRLPNLVNAGKISVAFSYFLFLSYDLKTIFCYYEFRGGVVLVGLEFNFG